MSAKKEQVVVNNVSFELYSLNFQSMGNETGNYNVSVRQDVVLDQCHKEDFTLLATRKIEFDPNTLFTIEIVLKIKYRIDKNKTDKIFISDVKKMKKHIEEHVNEFYGFSSANAHLSTIIAQITSWFGRNPLVMPEGINFIQEAEKK